MGVQKISVTVDSEMLKQARRMAPGGNLSQFANDAMTRAVKLRLIREYVAEEEAKHGPIPQELRDEVRRKWLD